MKKEKLYTVSALFLLITLFNCENKSSDEEEKKRLITGILINTATGSTSSASSSSSTACSVSTPAFSSLASAGTTTNCARSGCHVGSSPQSGLDMTNYSSVLSRVSSKNPSGSILYQKINGGSMQQYTTSQITTAIFCWIQGGALP
ncbi:MAG TPA: hypothetical protein PK079_02920 [Leptospiraceae bacterium]|nr:hypothetical protein [Leptospiraceae bacterium]HMW04457.1 hypothetical protein [Leptospiraceae bacterium]HMX31115.1 hypothetical protein [Leptospiraceae bacterium]HMY30643.1 hypothetical protein [Leptospiraceae bacterium]HMZ65824.1 hypothetical protein [Leptospiraceae bacterium]